MEIDVHELCMERSADACTTARSWIVGWSRELPASVAADVELLTHELVTNAFRHSVSERAWVTVMLLPDSVLVQVTDEGQGDPRIRPLVPFGESGRGLHWVSSLSGAWGIHKRNTTGVWFRVDYPSTSLACI